MLKFFKECRFDLPRLIEKDLKKPPTSSQDKNKVIKVVSTKQEILFCPIKIS